VGILPFFLLFFWGQKNGETYCFSSVRFGLVWFGLVWLFGSGFTPLYRFGLIPVAAVTLLLEQRWRSPRGREQKTVPLGVCFFASSSASAIAASPALFFLLLLPAADLSPHLIASADFLQNHTGAATVISTSPRKKIPIQNSSVCLVILQDL
jgi:hypothetical protein